MLKLALTALALTLPLLPSAVQAQAVQYVAYIGEQDLFSSQGVRLTTPSQVIRQDRANYHRFDLRQPGDEWDPLFGDFDNRAALEQYLRNGYISPEATRDIMAGGATVVVRIFDNGAQGRWAEVDVYR